SSSRSRNRVRVRVRVRLNYQRVARPPRLRSHFLDTRTGEGADGASVDRLEPSWPCQRPLPGGGRILVIFRVPKKRLDLLRPVLVETELHCEFSYSRANQIPHMKCPYARSMATGLVILAATAVLSSTASSGFAADKKLVVGFAQVGAESG